MQEYRNFEVSRIREAAILISRYIALSPKGSDGFPFLLQRIKTRIYRDSNMVANVALIHDHLRLFENVPWGWRNRDIEAADMECINSDRNLGKFKHDTAAW